MGCGRGGSRDTVLYSSLTRGEGTTCWRSCVSVYRFKKGSEEDQPGLVMPRNPWKEKKDLLAHERDRLH